MSKMPSSARDRPAFVPVVAPLVGLPVLPVVTTAAPNAAVVMSLFQAFHAPVLPELLTAARQANGVEDKDDSEPQRKKKKYSYVARKEEREQLEQEIQKLEARAAELRVAVGGAAIAQSAVFENAKLRDAAAEQYHVLSGVQSLLTEFMNGQSSTPLNSYIHLTASIEQRKDTLFALRAQKLAAGKKLLSARTRFMTPGRENWEESRFQTSDGDLCGLRFDISVFRGLESPKFVFDALLFYMVNAEIAMSEMNGTVTIRENDEGNLDDPNVLHHRLVTTSVGGATVEKNAVMFVDHCRSFDASTDGEFAFITSDFIDRDDLYPYVPSERLRKDLTAMMQISTHRDKDGKLAVALTRWLFLKVHACKLKDRELSPLEMAAVMDSQMSGMDGLLANIREFVATARATKETDQ